MAIKSDSHPDLDNPLGGLSLPKKTGESGENGEDAEDSTTND